MKRRDDYATDADKFFDSMSEPAASLARELRGLIRRAAPKATESIKWGMPVYEGIGLICAIRPFKKYVALQFYASGTSLPDPDGLLEGTGKKMRHVKIRAKSEIKSRLLTTWIKHAASDSVDRSRTRSAAPAGKAARQLGVQIRRYSLDDAPAVVEAVRESIVELRPWMPWCHPGYSLKESRSWLDIQVPSFEKGTVFEFAIVDADGRYLGGCGLNQIEPGNGRANLGYWVRTSAAGRGVATAAASALRNWAFANTDLIRLEILVAAGNVRSLQVAKKVGAVREGTLRSRLILLGVAHDAELFSITRPLPTARRRSGGKTAPRTRSR